MKILVIDIETTGFKPGIDEIVELGATSLDTETGELQKVFDQRCYSDELSIKDLANSWIGQNSDILHRFISSATPIEIALEDFQKALNWHKDGITAFNSDFDFKHLEANGIKIQEKLPCLMKASLDVVKARNQKGQIKWPSMEETARFLFKNSLYKEAHRAYQDSFDEAQIAYELIKMGKYLV